MYQYVFENYIHFIIKSKTGGRLRHQVPSLYNIWCYPVICYCTISLWSSTNWMSGFHSPVTILPLRKRNKQTVQANTCDTYGSYKWWFFFHGNWYICIHILSLKLWYIWRLTTTPLTGKSVKTEPYHRQKDILTPQSKSTMTRNFRFWSKKFFKTWHITILKLW